MTGAEAAYTQDGHMKDIPWNTTAFDVSILPAKHVARSWTLAFFWKDR